jgi:quercetin dioxygenase-like cupin family protein
MRELQIARWATADTSGKLNISTAERPMKMSNSDGTGESLLSQNGFGTDIIRFAAGEGVQNHIHEGDHILFVLAGNGFVVYDGQPHELNPVVFIELCQNINPCKEQKYM